MNIPVLRQTKLPLSYRGFIADNPILLFIVVLFLASYVFVPNFSTPFNLQNFVLQAIDIMIIAAGTTFVVLNGGIDFSSVSVLALGSVIGAYIMTESPLADTPLSIPIGILAMVGVGGLVGAVNGFSVVVLKMPSFIATLATMLIVSGLAVWFTSLVADTASIFGLPEQFIVIGGSSGHLYIPIAITAAALLFMYWLLSGSIFGRWLYATGTNPRTAFISGIPVKQTIFTIMLLSGLYAGLQSVISTARNQAGLPSLGDKVFIDIIAAIIVGGTSIFGGSGGVKNTLYGVVFITLINNVVNLLGIQWHVISLVKGILILGAAFIYISTRRFNRF